MIVKEGYVRRTSKAFKNKAVFLVKGNKGGGRIVLNTIYFPKEFIGKKVVFKVIEVKDSGGDLTWRG